MLAKPVENVDHEGPCVDNLLEARPLTDEAERVFAGPDQRPTAEALEAGIHAAVLRNELLLVAGLDTKPHDIECRHIVLPTAVCAAVTEAPCQYGRHRRATAFFTAL